MKLGTLFGAALVSNPDNWIYCRVVRSGKRQGKMVVRVEVINGAWNTTFDLDTKLSTNGGYRIAFEGTIPVKLREDYNAAIEYMRKKA